MKFQEKSGECGLAALLNARRAQGVTDLTMAQVRKAVRMDGTGTDELDLCRGMGVTSATAIRAHSAEEAVEDLHRTLDHGAPVILSVDDDTHWVTAVGTLGTDRVILVDPEMTKPNVKENGVQVLTWPELTARWKSKTGYLGLVVD